MSEPPLPTVIQTPPFAQYNPTGSQSVQYTIKPSAGFGIKFKKSSDILGGKKPLCSLLISRIELSSGANVPMPTAPVSIAIDEYSISIVHDPSTTQVESALQSGVPPSWLLTAHITNVSTVPPSYNPLAILVFLSYCSIPFSAPTPSIHSPSSIEVFAKNILDFCRTDNASLLEIMV